MEIRKIKLLELTKKRLKKLLKNSLIYAAVNLGGMKMSYTSFGEFMRILRIKNHEVMGDVAKVLEVKIPFLSAVENGKKNVPLDWKDKIINHYNLDKQEQLELEAAIEESKIQYKIIMNDSGINQRKAAMQFARSFDCIDDETAIKIMELLKNKQKERGN